MFKIRSRIISYNEMLKESFNKNKEFQRKKFNVTTSKENRVELVLSTVYFVKKKETLSRQQRISQTLLNINVKIGFGQE